MKRKYGWVKQLPDHRDIKFKAAPYKTLPLFVDLRSSCPPVYDQGSLGSCTANALASAYEFDQMKEGKEYFMPSRLFIYYNERVLEHTVHSDSGAQIRTGIKVLAQQGVCPETEWPYMPDQYQTLPSSSAFQQAKLHRAVSYSAIMDKDLQSIKAALAEGYPVVFGFTVYSAFEGARVAETGYLQMPTPLESFVGGHAVLCVGYDESIEHFIVRNSWGENWGLNGYFYMPFSYFSSGLGSDFWVVRTVQ